MTTHDHDEDTKAILTRRALLIRASLAGAGLVVGTGAGCEQSQTCLSMAGPCLSPDVQDGPEVCLTSADVPDVTEGPEVCLSPDVIESDVQVCLSRRIEDILDTDAPQVCLEDVPSVCLTDASQPCLSIAYPDVQDTSDDDGPQICLKIAPDAYEEPDGPQVCLSPPAPDVQG